MLSLSVVIFFKLCFTAGFIIHNKRRLWLPRFCMQFLQGEAKWRSILYWLWKGKKNTLTNFSKWNFMFKIKHHCRVLWNLHIHRIFYNLCHFKNWNFTCSHNKLTGFYSRIYLNFLLTANLYARCFSCIQIHFILKGFILRPTKYKKIFK